MKKKGFTLIELMVVVVIIGILSTIVMAALGSARNKAKDVTIKANMRNMQTEIELYRIDNDGYGTSESSYVSGVYTDYGFGADPCGPQLQDFMESISNIGSDTWCVTDGGLEYRISAQINETESGGYDYFCIDNTGYMGLATEPDDINCY